MKNNLFHLNKSKVCSFIFIYFFLVIYLFSSENDIEQLKKDNYELEKKLKERREFNFYENIQTQTDLK